MYTALLSISKFAELSITDNFADSSFKFGFDLILVEYGFVQYSLVTINKRSNKLVRFYAPKK